MLREHGIEVRPSLLPFTPWTTLDGVLDLLDFVADHDLVGNVDPVQYTIRLLLPEGSLLLDHPDLAPHLGAYDPERLTYTWTPPTPPVDALQLRLAALVEARVAAGASITDTLPRGASRGGRPRAHPRRLGRREATAHRAVVLLSGADRGPVRPSRNELRPGPTLRAAVGPELFRTPENFRPAPHHRRAPPPEGCGVQKLDWRSAKAFPS